MTASSADFFDLLECKMNVDGAALFCAGADMVNSAFARKARHRKRFPQPGAEADWDTFMTPAVVGRFAAHREAVAGGEIQESFFADLSKVEDVRRASGIIPVLVQNSTIRSETLKHQALSLEHLVFQGFPVLPAVTRKLSCPWMAALESEPGQPRAVTEPVLPTTGRLAARDADVLGLAGNAMHLAVVGAVFAFALSSVSRVSSFSVKFRHMTPFLFLASEEDDTQEQHSCHS